MMPRVRLISPMPTDVPPMPWQAKERCVVTVEVSSPGKKRQNRKIPDVCGHLSANCQNHFKFYRSLGFSTAWKKL